jgi:hypothetical protein
METVRVCDVAVDVGVVVGGVQVVGVGPVFEQ